MVMARLGGGSDEKLKINREWPFLWQTTVGSARHCFCSDKGLHCMLLRSFAKLCTVALHRSCEVINLVSVYSTYDQLVIAICLINEGV